MKHLFRFLCLMTMLCYSMSGFSETVTMNVGDSYTIIETEVYNVSSSTHMPLFDYSWTVDPSYFAVEYAAVHNSPASSSSGYNVAKVTIIAPFSGSKTIKCTARYYDGPTSTTQKTTTFTHTIQCNQVNVALYPTTMSIVVGESQNLQWRFSPVTANYAPDVTFTSNNVNVAQVDFNGNVIAKGAGTATITAKTNYGTTATCQVTVNPLLASSISLSQTSMNLPIGATRTLTETILPIITSNKAVTWVSSNNDIATVDANGNVNAISQGTANITATTLDGSNLTADCLIMVYPEQQPSGLLGDVDGDGKISVADVTALIDMLLNK